MRAESRAAEGGRERRRFKRAHMLFRGRLLSSGQSVRAVIMDLSANGARLQLGEPWREASPLTLQLAGSVYLGAEIAWRSETNLGLRFHDRPERVCSICAALLPEDCLAAA